ncbi:MAG: hypothetical protein IPO39_15740 [Bacteroidetes bacterium]|nr:hypothetical protein [Bacteroidota bacterium]
MIARFTPALFWDTDINTLSETTHSAYIIVRVCMLGTWEDWLLLKKMYGLDKIQTELLNARSLDPKTLNYFSLILNIPKEKFRCFSFQPPQALKAGGAIL